LDACLAWESARTLARLGLGLGGKRLVFAVGGAVMRELRELEAHRSFFAYQELGDGCA
jgi:hypothetical protein